jgi:hypothetical protein
MFFKTVVNKDAIRSYPLLGQKNALTIMFWKFLNNTVRMYAKQKMEFYVVTYFKIHNVALKPHATKG